MESNNFIQCTFVWLTYPQSGSLSKEGVLNMLKDKNAKWAIVSLENHDKDGVHIHALCGLSVKLRVSGTRFAEYWDIDMSGDKERIQGENFWHGHYKAVIGTRANLGRIIKYICVEDGCDKEPLVWNIDWQQYLDRKGHRKIYGLDTLREIGVKRACEEGLISVKDVKSVSAGLKILNLYDIPKYTKNTKGLWLWGRAGLGKTSFVTDMGHAYGGLFRKGVNRWWDGYNKEGVVVMDDPSLVKLQSLMDRLKVWADQAPCMGEVKGDTIWCHHKHFVITTNWDPRLVCDQVEEFNAEDKDGQKTLKRRKSFDDEGWAAIRRRFRIVHVDDILVDKYGVRKDGLHLCFNPVEFPDNEWCEFNDIVPSFDRMKCLDALREKFPVYDKKGFTERMRMWCSWVPKWLAAHPEEVIKSCEEHVPLEAEGSQAADVNTPDTKHVPLEAEGGQAADVLSPDYVYPGEFDFRH